MTHTHKYQVSTNWTGAGPEGTKHIRTYSRTHVAVVDGKPELTLTTDNPAVGDKSKWNPEDLLVTALSSCHMLSYLYVCALEGIVITGYRDLATGVMEELDTDGGSFKEVVLHPEFSVAAPEMKERAMELHHRAHEICFIANSVNFPVICNPVCLTN